MWHGSNGTPLPTQGVALADFDKTGNGLHCLVRRLEKIAELAEDDKQQLLGLPAHIRSFEADQDVVREGDRPAECGLVVEGFVCRYKVVADGRRQIMSFHTTGDLPDLHSLHLPVLDDSIAALVPTRMAFIPHPAIEHLVRHNPTIANALWRMTLIDASIFREWMLGLGRRSAYQRVAHLLCETAFRLKQVGLGDERGYAFPITQSELGDALGISTVHANRVVQELRRNQLIIWHGATVTILDWEGLQLAADFDPAYLHQRPD